MPRSPSEVVDEFTVSLLVLRHGWISVTLTTPRREAICMMSSVFGDAVTALIDLCRGVIDGRACEARFLDEPGACVWALTPIPTQQHTMLLRVYEFDRDPIDGDDRPSDLRPRVEMIVKRRQLATMLIGELWKTATLSREPSFQRGRRTFRVEPYLQLLQRWEEWTSERSPPPGAA